MHMSLEQLSLETFLLISMAAAHRLVPKGSSSTCCSVASDDPAAGQAAKPTQAAPNQGPAHMSMPEGVRDTGLAAGSVHGLAEMPPSKPMVASPRSPPCTADGECRGRNLPSSTEHV